MKIVVIGTSNSVMGEQGYIRALRHRHEVINLSSGRVGIAFHINRLLEHWQMIEEADLLIVDHYINDMSEHSTLSGYTADVTTFLDMLACLNTRVINLLFPHQAPEHLSLRFYDHAVTASNARQIAVVDLNLSGFKPAHFMDKIHLSRTTSYMVGIILAREIARLDLMPKPAGGAIHTMPFRRYTFAELAPDLPQKRFEGTIMEFDYTKLTQQIPLPLTRNESIFALGYFIPKGETAHCGIAIGDRQIGLCNDVQGYFHEIINTVVMGPDQLAPVIGEGLHLENAMNRGAAHGTFTPPLLVDMTVRNHDLQFSGTPASRCALQIDMAGTVEALGRTALRPVSPALIDEIRDQALAEEPHNLATAHSLMAIAAALRPKGLLIQQKLAEYQSRLADTGQTKANSRISRLRKKCMFWVIESR